MQQGVSLIIWPISWNISWSLLDLFRIGWRSHWKHLGDGARNLGSWLVDSAVSCTSCIFLLPVEAVWVQLEAPSVYLNSHHNHVCACMCICVYKCTYEHICTFKYTNTYVSVCIYCVHTHAHNSVVFRGTKGKLIGCREQFRWTRRHDCCNAGLSGVSSTDGGAAHL